MVELNAVRHKSHYKFFSHLGSFGRQICKINFWDYVDAGMVAHFLQVYFAILQNPIPPKGVRLYTERSGKTRFNGP